MSNSPELLYHIILTVIDYHVDPSEAKQSIYISGTNATLEAAESSAFRVLGTLRNKPEDLGELADLFNKEDEVVKQIIAQVISVICNKGYEIRRCGQKPSKYPEFAKFLVDAGIDSISVSPDSLVAVTRHVVATVQS
ncbi:hypothetical protein BKA60DRAFT_644535 [Fusarium oxysporum]|nr:hypothetical protein BKA60DRAFT_644535 [Fusarium oxysporum]